MLVMMVLRDAIGRKLTRANKPAPHSGPPNHTKASCHVGAPASAGPGRCRGMNHAPGSSAQLKTFLIIPGFEGGFLAEAGVQPPARLLPPQAP